MPSSLIESHIIQDRTGDDPISSQVDILYSLVEMMEKTFESWKLVNQVYHW